MKTLASSASLVLLLLASACGAQLVEFDDAAGGAGGQGGGGGLGGHAGGGGLGGGGVGGSVPVDETPPLVTATFPAMAAIDVASNGTLSATFTERMAPATIDAASFTLFAGATPVAGTVSYAGVTATLRPTTPLTAQTNYTATITAEATDLAGNALTADYVWTFTTGAGADTTAPEVSSTTPARGATDVARNAPIAATFTEPMDPLTIDGAAFTLSVGATPVAGEVLFVGVTALFVPTQVLAPETLFTARVTTAATDLAGNALAVDYVFTFSTGTAPDSTPPQVSSTSPVDGASLVPLGGPLTATFSEAMNPLTISAASFTLRAGAVVIPATVTYAGVTARLEPTLPLLPSTLYVATIASSVTDLAGQSMADPFVWSFLTGIAPDVTPPEVTATVPLDAAIGVPLDAAITATFSEPMDAATITTLTFTLANGVLAVPAAVTYVGLTATLTPAAPLLPDTVYTATILVGARDIAGLGLAAPYVFGFTTGALPDIVPPAVTFTAPSDDATGVAIGGDIAAVFSEPMDASTVTTANFTVQQLGTIVAGTVTYASVTATFHPLLPLAPNTIYSATLTTALRDLAGNRLVRNYVWNFRTGATPDTTRPTVLSVIPLAGAIDVVLNTDVSATFNEVMDPLSLGATSFTLFAGLVQVPGTVASVGATVVLDPTLDLAPGTLHTATITTAARDLAGNTLLVDFVWSFTTGAALDPTAPTVILTSPVDLATGVPLASAVNATFSEAMDPLTITTVNFLLAGPGIVDVPGTVLYDALTHIGTFTPLVELLPATTYVATITTGVRDLAGNAMAAEHVWSFSTGNALPPALAGIDLGTLGTFVAVAGAGLTNSNSSGVTTLNGDVGLSPTATCLGDGSPCTALNPVINGTLYANDPGGIAAQAKVDLTAAYVDAMSRPPGTTVNDLSGMVLAPGVYTSASTMSVAVGGQVTLDGQGDANSVWIFQVGSSLTVNNNAQILLINGAAAKNVYWAIFASSTIGSTVSFQGSVLAGASNSVGTDSVVVGRLLCRTGQITLLSNTITLPPI